MAQVTLWPLFDEEDEDYDEHDSSSASSGGAAPSVTFPITSLVLRVQIALGADLSADPLTWGWADITEFVRFDLGISLTEGRRDESTQVSTGSGQMKLDNRDGRFTRRNPTGPYYGLLSKNTPIWVTLDAGSGQKTRMEMFVNEWPKRWTDRSAVDSTVTIQCAGIMRRLAQGSVLKSALRQTYSADSLVAYWPMEEEGPSFRVASGIVGGSPTTSPVELTFVDGQAGTLRALSLNGQDTAFYLPFTFTLPNATGWQFEIVGCSDAGIDTVFLNVKWGAGVTDNFAVLISAARADGTPRLFAFRLLQNGSNVGLDFYVDGVLSSSSDLGAGTLTTTPVIYVAVGASTTDTTTACHLAVYSYAAMPSLTAHGIAANGYNGEQAHARIARLCNQEGIPYQSSAGDSPNMGPQSVDTLLKTLRECEAVGGGVLYEKRWGLAYQSLAERYNAPVGLALDFVQGHIAEEPEAADDDQRTRNRWTTSRSGGSEFTAEQTTGEMGTGAQGPGVYGDSVTLNVQTDAQLLHQAGWRLHLGTIDEDRYPSIALNFAHDPDLIDTWAALPYGARVTVDNPLAQMPPGQIDQIIEGHSERWDSKQWTASLNCSPASAYRVHVLASTDGNLGRLSSSGSSLAADVTSGATTLQVAFTGRRWVTGTVNFDIAAGGERMTVTDIAGTTSPQTFTVTRSVNSVVKAHTSGESVALWNPAVLGMG